MKIDWNYPEPRTGILGAVDKFIGPGATKTEVVLQLYIPIVAALLAPLYALTLPVEWNLLQYFVCALLAGDMVGGLITNATSSAKRWYHREDQHFNDHFKFLSLHLLHLLLVSWLYLSLDIAWVVCCGAYLLMAGVIILKVPVYVQRSISLILYSGAILLSMYVLTTPIGLEWFLPFFYLKLLVSHLPREEPYRPDEKDSDQIKE